MTILYNDRLARCSLANPLPFDFSLGKMMAI